MATILLATADYTSFAILDAEISAEGHTVIHATDGNEAYQQALSEQPHLIIIDPVLPVFNGYELALMLREDPDVPERLPVLILTDEEPDVRKLEKAGITGVLPKTHAGAEIREILAAQLRENAGPQI